MRKLGQGYYKGHSVIRVFNIYAWNLYKKYGESWKTESFQRACSRLKSWGMNTYYSWSVPTLLGMSGIPYAALISTRNSRRIEGSSGYWGKFPDPFDNSFGKVIEFELENIKKSASDPFCIGYFVDNEMDWGDDLYLAKSAIQSDKDQPAKQAMLDFLKKKYNTVNQLNAAWQTTFNSWDEFMENTSVPAGGAADFKAISAIIAREYFKIVKETLTKNAPHKLYLGCRFHNHYYPDEDTTCNWVMEIAAEYCDVVSFNRYRYTAIDLRPALADKPVIISEWHMGALDRGLPHYTLRFTESQENRAEMYEYFLGSCLKNPFIVGAHWFEYIDEPVTGRFDGENFNTGFVDVCDRPYPEMIAASRKMGKTMYRMRFYE
ncbi:MAG: beta-galactosidase [Firmicutes bacterium]|nr:beta-galactosidase [Bacillota bacterium]